MKNKKLLMILGLLSACLVLFFIFKSPLSSKPENEHDTNETEKDNVNSEDEQKDDVNIEEEGSFIQGIAPNHPQDTIDNSNYLLLPFDIPNASLQLQNVASYNGIFLEDGSDVEVNNVAVVVLKNKGNKPIEIVQLKVMSENTTYSFEGSNIPVDGTIVLQEKNMLAYSDGNITNVDCKVGEIDQLDLAVKQIKFTDNGDGSIQLENITNQDIPCVRMFYKFFDQEESVYIGGITYTAKVTNLKAHDSININPSHYIANSSKVTMIRTYNEID